MYVIVELESESGQRETALKSFYKHVKSTFDTTSQPQGNNNENVARLANNADGPNPQQPAVYSVKKDRIVQQLNGELVIRTYSVHNQSSECLLDDFYKLLLHQRQYQTKDDGSTQALTPSSSGHPASDSGSSSNGYWISQPLRDLIARRLAHCRRSGAMVCPPVGLLASVGSHSNKRGHGGGMFRRQKSANSSNFTSGTAATSKGGTGEDPGSRQVQQPPRLQTKGSMLSDIDAADSVNHDSAETVASPVSSVKLDWPLVVLLPPGKGTSSTVAETDSAAKSNILPVIYKTMSSGSIASLVHLLNLSSVTLDDAIIERVCAAWISRLLHRDLASMEWPLESLGVLEWMQKEIELILTNSSNMTAISNS